jgi:hypothetical protein
MIHYYSLNDNGEKRHSELCGFQTYCTLPHDKTQNHTCIHRIGSIPTFSASVNSVHVTSGKSKTGITFISFTIHQWISALKRQLRMHATTPLRRMGFLERTFVTMKQSINLGQHDIIMPYKINTTYLLQATNHVTSCD